MPEVDEFGIPIKNKAVKVSESSSSDEFGIPIKPKSEQPPVKKKSTVSPWQSIIPTVEAPKVQDQAQSSTGQVAPLEVSVSGLGKNQPINTGISSTASEPVQNQNAVKPTQTPELAPPVKINRGTETGVVYKGLPMKGFEDKTYVLKNSNGIDVWQEYNPNNKDIVLGKANKYLNLSKEGNSEGGFSGGEKQKNAKLALTQLAEKVGVKVSSTDGPEDIYRKIQSSDQLGEMYKNITDPTRIKTLNENFKAGASTNEGVQTYVGYPEEGKQENEYRITQLPITKEKVWEVRRKGQKEFTTISDEGSINSLNRWTGNQVEVSNDAKAKRDAEIKRQESAVNNFKLVNSRMFDLAEGDAVPYLQKLYGKYGFTFAESGLFGKDEVTVTSKNGGQPMTFSLDNWTQGADASEASKLRRWMIENQYNDDYIDRERQVVEDAKAAYDRSKYEQDILSPEQVALQSKSDMQQPITFNPLDAKNKFSAPAKFVQEISANTVMTEKINAQRRLTDLSGKAKTQKEKDELATIAIANQNILKDEADIQDTYIEDLSKQNDYLNKSVEELKQETTSFYKQLEQQGINPNQLEIFPELAAKKEDLDQRAKSIESRSNEIVSDMAALKSMNTENQKNAGLYIAFNENRGNVMGGLVNSALKGVAALPDALLNNASGGDNNFASKALISLLGSDYTTKEFQASDDRWDLTKSAFGAIESLGAAVSGKGLGKLTEGTGKLMAISEELPFMAMSYNELKSEMSGDEWYGVSSFEKEGLALIYSYINGKLEKLGTDALLDTGKISKDVSKNLILKTIAGLKPGATTEAMDLALQTNFKKFILSSAYNLGKDFTSEAKTGAMQELSGITLKNTYNILKEKEMFKEVPNTVADITDAVMSGAYMEGLGGLAFSVPKTAVKAAQLGYSKAFKDPEELAFAEKIFNDSDMRVMILNDIKSKTISGEITEQEGRERIDAIDRTNALFEKLPEGIRTEDKPQVLDLIVERAKIQAEIEGKEKTLVQDKTERINEINAQLKEIGARKQTANATEATPTEETTTDVTPTENVVTPPAEAVVVEKPTVQIDENKASSYTGKDDRFYPESLVMEMSPEELSQLTIVNPSPEVQARIEEVFPAEKTTTNEVATSTETKKEEVVPVKNVKDRTESPISIDEIGEGFVLHRGSENGGSEGFNSLDETSATEYASNGGKVESAVIKKGSKVLRLVTGDTDNYSDNQSDIDEFYAIIGEDQRNQQSEWGVGNEPSDITTRLWGNPKVVAKLKEAGVDIVIGNTIDGPDAYVVNKDAVEPLKNEAQKPSEKSAENVDKQTEQKTEDVKQERTPEEISKDLNNVISEIDTRVSEKNPSVNLMLNEKNGKINVNAIFVKEENRNQGLASKVLTDLKSEADKIGKIITLKATDELGGDITKLESFYTKNGFKKIGENTYEYDPNNSNDGNDKTSEKSAKNVDKQIEQKPSEKSAETQDIKTEEKPTRETTSEEMVMPGENQKRRDEGKFTKDGVEYVRNEPTENVRGKEGEVRFTESTKEGFTYKLVEAEELQPSHQNGQRNPTHFIPEAQPKSRTDVGSIAAEQSFANNPRFDSLGQDQDAYSGAPVVNERNEVIQGNNRSAGLKKGYNQGSTQYKQDLASNAKKFGFTKEQVEGMKNPILVREIKVDDDKAIELGNYDVKDMETGGKSRIDAVSLSRRIPLNARQQITDLLFKDDNVTLNESIRKNQAKVTEILRKYLNQAQRTSLSKDGELTKNAISDIEELVKQFLFDGADTQLSDVFENLPKTVQEGVRKSMPYIFGVDFNNSILSDVQNGLVALNQFIASGINDFGEWKNQQDMFNDGKTPVDMFSPLAVAIAEKLNSSKQTEIVGYFKKYASETKGTEADMFNEATEGKTKEQATKDIFGESSTEKKSSSVKQAPKKTETKPSPSDKKTIDKAISFLDDLEKQLSAFGKETIGMNIPVALLQTAVKVAKTSLKAGKALSEAITDAIDFIKNSDFYKGLSDSEQKTVVSNVESVFSGEKKFEEIVEKPKQETKTDTSKPKGQNTSRQSERAIEMQEDENPELAKRIKGLSSYERQDQKEFFDNVSSIIDDMGEVASVDFAINPSNSVPAEVREAILTIAAARYGSSAMEKQNRAIELNDDQLLAEAEYELEKSMLWNLEASQYATKAGQIIAFKNKIYNEFPAFFSLSKKKEFDNKFGAKQEVKEEIKELQDDISRGVDSIVDDLTTNEEIEALKAQVEELQSKLADSKKSAGNRNQKSDEKIKEIKQKRKDLFAQLKNESRGGQVSASIGFMNSNQIEIIGKIVASYIEEGIVRTDKIVNEIYRNLKDSYPALRKEHIRSIARENPDFETLQNNEAQKKEKTKLEKLQEKLANLQKGEGEITETINREDSDEVKQIKKQIEEEKILSPKVLRQLVKDYLRGNKMNYRSLADAIAQKSGKSIEEVQDLADLMEEKIRVKVEELVKKEHKKFIEKTNSSAEKTKTKDLKYRKQKGIATEEELAELDRRLEDQRSKSEIKRIMQTIMMGGLGSSSDFRKAFEGRFGFKELSETTQKQVDALAFEIFDIQREVDRQVVNSEGKKVALTPLKRQRLAILQKKLNTLLESNKPWTVGKVLKEINSAIYIHILSGPVTFARAFIGGYVSGALGFGAYNFINIANYKHLARGYREMIKALPAAYIKAVQSRKTGVDFFGATGLSGEIGGYTFGAYESAIFKGLNDAMKNKETGKVFIKSYGQALKVIHALGALDTFMNTITGTFVGTVEASKRGEFNQINDAEYKQIAHEDWFYFLKAVGKLVDIQNPDLDFESRVKKIDSMVRQELGITGSRYNAKKVFTANRIQELRENALGKYFEQGVSLSKDASMMGKPDGLTGVLVDKLQKASTISDSDNTVAATLKFIPNLIFKFTRITGQVINKSFNNIPLIGIANAAIGVGRNMETGEFEHGFLQRAKSNPLLFRQRVATNLLTTATLIGAYALMFDDDDEEGLKLDENRPFDLRGFGGDDQKLQRKYENYRNLSISFTKDKNGKWTNYVELKLVPEMSAIAGMLGYFGDVMKGDVELSSKKEVQKVLLERFKKEGLSTRNIFKAMSENTKIFTESSFSSVGSISRNYKSGEQDGGFMGGIGNVALNLMVDIIKPLVEPRVVESVIKTVSKVNGFEEKELKDWEYFAKNLYGLDSFFSDNKTDVFGNTYKKESDYEKFMKDTFGVGKKRSEDFKDVALLYKFEQGANISKRKFTEMKPDSKEGFTVTYNSPFGKVTKKYLSADKSIVDETQSIQEAEFKRLVDDNYKSLNSLETKDKLEKRLKELQDKSTEYAKKEIVKKYDGTKKIESIDK